MKPTLEERFWARVQKTETCWLWTGSKNGNGYGFISQRPLPRVSAHRFAYELFKGPIPDGLEPDHLCRVRHCVYPAHLEAVDHRTNTLRGETIAAYNAAKTHCINGHPFDSENTYRRQGVWRGCRTCNRVYQKRAREKARNT